VNDAATRRCLCENRGIVCEDDEIKIQMRTVW